MQRQDGGPKDRKPHLQNAISFRITSDWRTQNMNFELLLCDARTVGGGMYLHFLTAKFTEEEELNRRRYRSTHLPMRICTAKQR